MKHKIKGFFTGKNRGVCPFCSTPVKGAGFLPGFVRKKNSAVFLILLLLPVLLFSLLQPGRTQEEAEDQLKTLSGLEKIRLLNELARKYIETAPDKSLEYAKEALHLAKDAGDADEMAAAFNSIGGHYYVSNRFREAVEYYLEGLKLEPQIENKNLIANFYTNVGMVYWKLKDFDMAEKYHLRGLEIRKKVGAGDTQMGFTLNNLGLVAAGKGEYIKALRYYREALQLYSQANHKRGKVAALNNIAFIQWKHFKNYPKALEYLRETIPLYEELGLQWGVARAKDNIGSVYVEMGRFAQAETYLQSALESAEKIKAGLLIHQIYESFIDLYKASGDFKKALQNLKKSAEWRDILFNEETNRQIARLHAKYEAERKDREIRLLRGKNEREGRLRLFLMIGAALFLGSGLALYVRYSIKKRTNHLLSKNEAKYRALFSQAGGAIFLADRSAFVECNEKTLEMFGVTRERIIGYTFADFSPHTQPDTRDSFSAGKEYILKALAGEAQHFSWRHIKKDGTPFDAMVSLTAVNVNGREFLQAIVHDISHRKRLQEERIKAARWETISLLANGISHDFDELFGGMLRDLEKAEAKTSSRIRLKPYLAALKIAVSSAVALSKQFRAIAEQGFQSKQVIHIGGIIREAVEAMLKKSDAAVLCRFEISSVLWPIEGDAPQMNRVMENLTRNALNAMGLAGEMEVTAVNIELKSDEESSLPAGNYVHISVKDNGRGIEPENLAKIFDPYFSTSRDVTRKGLGMGLAAVQAIIKRHRGVIEVSSQPGAGAVFHIYLPAMVEINHAA